MKYIVFLAVLALLASCGDKNARFQIAPGVATTEVRLRVQTIEVRDVTLPTFAAAAEILSQGPDGALRPIRGAIWADDPPRGITYALARSLDLRSSASVAAEPWPLSEPPDVRLEVRFDQILAKTDGRFALSGQYALASPNGKISERLYRFDISVPLPDASASAAATASGAAIDRLADEIVSRLR